MKYVPINFFLMKHLDLAVSFCKITETEQRGEAYLGAGGLAGSLAAAAAAAGRRLFWLLRVLLMASPRPAAALESTVSSFSFRSIVSENPLFPELLVPTSPSPAAVAPPGSPSLSSVASSPISPAAAITSPPLKSPKKQKNFLVLLVA